MKRACTLCIVVLFTLLFSPLTRSSAYTEVAGDPRANNYINDIGGRSGAFDIETPEDVEAAAKAGITLALTPGYSDGGALDLALKKHGVGTIDSYPWNRLYQACAPQLNLTHQCSIPEDEKNKIVSDITLYVRARSGDRNTKAYWILDDYPGGDVKDVLARIHAAIAMVRPNSRLPTICGFGGLLDKKGSEAADDQVFGRAITNFTASGCDYIALYVYASDKSNDANAIDWSMARLMPRYLSFLRQTGWNPSRTPMIGIAQTFYYSGISQNYFVRPHPEDITDQVSSFCEFGAVAILGYAWDDSYKGSKAELGNDAGFVAGFRAGIDRCQKGRWAKKGP
jgi:hypothetical protein